MPLKAKEREEDLCWIGLPIYGRPNTPSGVRHDPWDIVCVMRGHFMGKATINDFVWVPLQGWEWIYMSMLRQGMHDPPIDPFDLDVIRDESTLIGRYRFCIRPEDLAREFPEFDLDQVVNPGVVYQPGGVFNVTPRGIGRFDPDLVQPVHPDGFVWDKQIQGYVYG